MPMKRPIGADPPVPAEAASRFDGDARRGSEHLRLIVGGLLLEQLPAWHRNDSRLDALRLKRLSRRNRELHFGAGRKERHIALPIGVAENVGAARR